MELHRDTLLLNQYGEHRLDADLVQQIYPVVEYAKKNVPDLKLEDKEALTADLYLAMVEYSNKEIRGYLGRLRRLEDLKTDKNGHIKDQEFLDNLQKQQESILEESRLKQTDLLSKVYNEWLEKLKEDNG